MTSTLFQCGGKNPVLTGRNLRQSKAQRGQPSASTGWTEAKEKSEKMSEKKGKKIAKLSNGDVISK